MRTHFALILFCLLLLPIVGSGQQVHLAYGSGIFGGARIHITETVIAGVDIGQYYYLPKGSDSLYKTKRVKTIEVFDSSGKKHLTISFNKKGQNIGWEKDNLHFHKKVSVKGVKRKIVMKLIHHNKTLGKEIHRYSTKTTFRYGIPIQITKSSKSFFARARLINRRNADYNRNYYKVPTGEEGEKYLKKRFITFYPGFLVLKRQKQWNSQAIRNYQNFDIEANILTIETNRLKTDAWIEKHNKQHTKTYVDGENFYKIIASNLAGHPICGSSFYENNSFQNDEKCNRGIEEAYNHSQLLDTVFMIYRPIAIGEEYERKKEKFLRQKSKNVIIRPGELRFRSDSVQKSLLYTLRYEYFDE